MSKAVVNNERIAKNTIMLYFRMIFMMAISLYTSRIILQTLGVEDFGIYNVVGGFVSFLGFLTGAISTSSSRYITFSLGKGNIDQLKKVFSTCLLTHIVIAIVIFVIAETFGLWFVLQKLTIPDSRVSAAMWVYQCSIVSSLVMIWSVPYNACIIAHEKMSAFAYISIFEVIAKLAVVYVLMLGLTDNLILYGVLLLFVQLIVRYIYTYYCHKHFEESQFKFVWDKTLFREILSFASWSLWGNLAGVLYTHGINILLNMFFGPAVNAARAIAVQVQSSVQMFAANFQTAINPQITKSYANNDLLAMCSLIYRSSKFTFFLLFCLTLPLMLNTEFVLGLWLGQVPECTVVFLRIMLVICFFEAMSNPFSVSVSATGNVKFFQSVIGGILLLIAPCAYVSLYLGGNPESVFYVHLFIAFIAYFCRLYILKTMIDLSIKQFFLQALIPCILVGLFAGVSSYLITYNLPKSIWGSLLSIIFSIILSVIAIYFVGLSIKERLFLQNKISSFVLKTKE